MCEAFQFVLKGSSSGVFHQPWSQPNIEGISFVSGKYTTFCSMGCAFRLQFKEYMYNCNGRLNILFNLCTGQFQNRPPPGQVLLSVLFYGQHSMVVHYLPLNL